MATEEGTVVELYIYDLTNGLASLFSPSIIGRQIEGVWHTSVVAFQREYFFGGNGVTSCPPGGTLLGAPKRVERLGVTFVTARVLDDYVYSIGTSTYSPETYNLLEHNCNHFSDELAEFLCGARVPKHIVEQPEMLLTPEQRTTLQTLFDAITPQEPRDIYLNGAAHRHRERHDSPDYLTLNTQIEEARIQSQELEQRRNTLAEKVARKERKKEKKRKKQQRERGDEDGADSDMAEAVEAPCTGALEELSRAGPSSQALELEADERRQEEQRKRSRDPPIVYKDIDGAAEYEKLASCLDGVELSSEDRSSLFELEQYLVQGEGSWVLGDDFLGFIGRLLGSPTPATCERVLRCLAASALRDDASLLLHQDRRNHTLLNYAYSIDALTPVEQRALALFMCNLFENISSSEWLLYISEWESKGQALSNIRVTTKVCVHCALSEDAELRELGTALMHNVATKEVFDEVCVELSMALLELLQRAPAEEHLFRACKALARLALHSNDVPQLVSMVGPDPAAFRGTSARVDEQIDLIMSKLK